MKLKDFFFSTLPRSRKSKRKQSKNAQPCSGGSTNAGAIEVISRNHELNSNVINGNSEKAKNRVPNLASSAPAQTGYVSNFSHNRFLVSSNFQYYTDKNSGSFTNPSGHQTLAKTPSNASESGFEDGQDHYNNYDSYSLRPNFQTSVDPSQHPDILTNSYNTFPRERTRIKTNPWVSTNANTMTSSIHGQAANGRYRSPYSVTPSSSYGSSRFIDYNSNDNNGNSDYHRDSSSGSSLAPDSSVPSSPMTGHGIYSDVSPPAFFDEYHSKQDGVLEGGDLVINLNTGDVFVKPKPDFSPISFQYEDDLDATLERDNGRRKTKSRRKRDDDKCLYLRQEDLDAKAGGSQRDVEDCEEFVMDFSDRLVDDEFDNDVDRENTLTRDNGTPQWSYHANNNQACRKRGHKQRKNRMEALMKGESDTPCAYSPYESSHFYDKDQYDPREYEENVAMLDLSPHLAGADPVYDNMMSSHLEGTDSAYDSSTLSSVTGASIHKQLSLLERQDTVDQFQAPQRPITLPGVTHRKHKAHRSDSTNRRSLEEIHCGLKEKVCRLKAEKRVVDEKIKQAKEEEELRRQEKTRIEQEVTSLRKQVLLQTLQDLKDNLSEQSGRLQEAYDDVLDMQWLSAKLRRLRNTTL